MYITYEIDFDGDYMFFVERAPWWAGLGPTECVWMVPGTIND